MIRRMEQFSRFSDEDRLLLEDLTSKRQRIYQPGEDIVREGEHSPDIHIVLSGLACRYKLLENGTRQIMAFLVPGDPCDSEIFILKAMDHSIGALAPSLIASSPHRLIASSPHRLIASVAGDVMKDMLLHRPGIALAFWWSTLQDEGILRERIIDEGRRDAYSRIAFMICEVLLRMRAVGVIRDESFEFPITQADLADATGLTPVHVNRMLQRLREEGLIEVKNRVWTVLDTEGLKKVARFDPNYLHLDRAKDEPDSEAGKRLKGLI
jgi:CRP-like cAMP-binding protein